MFVRVRSAALWGIDMVGVSVEVNVSPRGFPGFEIVGLAHKSVSESKERVKTSVLNSGFTFPSDKKVIVNLAPADLPKDGSFYDLPIAIATIASVSNLPIPTDSLYFGELSLDGSLRKVRGAFLFALFAKENGFRRIFVPEDSFREASCIESLEVLAFKNLFDVVAYLKNGIYKKPLVERGGFNQQGLQPDICDILGQESAKRVLEISAAGGHNTIMVGPPGVGKTMLGRVLTSILPDLSSEESIEVTKIHSVKGDVAQYGLINTPPFRDPHHTISYSALLGGGVPLRPGEISLAHRGVLFMDEFSEFSRSAIECLRQPLEDGYFQIRRSGGTYRFPCKFILIAASNPCLCGYYGHPTKPCKCTPPQRQRYRQRISGPLLDRIDLHINVQPVNVDNLAKITPHFLTHTVDNSNKVRQRVVLAREIQKKRYHGLNISLNSQMKNEQVKVFCALNRESEILMSQAVAKYGFSARSYFKILKVARTIADLSGSESIKADYIAEAFQYRMDLT